jgi:hypothetical protein
MLFAILISCSRKIAIFKSLGYQLTYLSFHYLPSFLVRALITFLQIVVSIVFRLLGKLAIDLCFLLVERTLYQMHATTFTSKSILLLYQQYWRTILTSFTYTNYLFLFSFPCLISLAMLFLLGFVLIHLFASLLKNLSMFNYQ